MNKIYQKTFPGEKNAGFTLIELLVVVLIIGILAAVAVPKYQRAVEKSQLMISIQMATKVRSAQELFWLANGRYASNMEDLDLSFPDCTMNSAKSGWWCKNNFTVTGRYGGYVGFFPWGPGFGGIWCSGPEKRKRKGKMGGDMMFFF